eukprot:scaffold72490_cov26-Tisochrysis_lutea.AAC.6
MDEYHLPLLHGSPGLPELVVSAAHTRQTLAGRWQGQAQWHGSQSADKTTSSPKLKLPDESGEDGIQMELLSWKQAEHRAHSCRLNTRTNTQCP